MSTKATEQNLRFSRQILLPEIGTAGQKLLSEASVLVIGAGGLGCPALLHLAAAGVGTLGVADFDTVSLSNLHRQTLYTTEDIGKKKTEAAIARLRSINPETIIKSYPEGINRMNAVAIFENFDVVIDCTDRIEMRYLTDDVSALTKVPFVYGAVHKFTGYVSVFNYNGGSSYRCLFPIPPEQGAVQGCNEVGVIGFVTGLTGTMQAAEAIKIILGAGDILSGKLLMADFLHHQYQIFTVPRTEADRPQSAIAIQQFRYEAFCNQLSETSLSIDCTGLRGLLASHPSFPVIDVRVNAP